MARTDHGNLLFFIDENEAAAVCRKMQKRREEELAAWEKHKDMIEKMGERI